MKSLLQKIANFYNTNAKFHSFVLAVEYGAASFITAYFSTASLPTSKKALVAFLVGMGGAVVAAVKRWLVTNLATKTMQLKSQPE